MIAEIEADGPVAKAPPAALPTERLHCVLRRMPDADWTRLRGLLGEHLNRPDLEADIDLMEGLLRRDEALDPRAGGAIVRMTQAILATPALVDFVREAKERLRQRIRFVLQEMSEEDWLVAKGLLAAHLGGETKAEEIRLLELVFRIGESVSNIETAATALADQASGRKLLAPEVARRNAMMRAAAAGGPRVDPEAAYREAKQAIAAAAATLARAQSTLAYRLVAPTSAFRHARNTLFKTVDAILESQALMAEIVRIEANLERVGPVTREEMRWALHRMPVPQRMRVLKLIPLNTILVFHDPAEREAATDIPLRATRDRRLAYELFVKGRSDDELAAAYGLKVNAVKNAIGAMLQALLARPLARQAVREYLERARGIAPMSPDEVRRRMKQLTAQQRAELLSGLPGCAWKVRSAMLLHKHLFLDYLSGDWVLSALVDYYNLEKRERLTGTFKFQETLTLRGTQAAIAGVYQKIAEEPDVRQRLRDWTETPPGPTSLCAEGGLDAEEPAATDLLPPLPGTSPPGESLTAPAEAERDRCPAL